MNRAKQINLILLCLIFVIQRSFLFGKKWKTDGVGRREWANCANAVKLSCFHSRLSDFDCCCHWSQAAFDFTERGRGRAGSGTRHSFPSLEILQWADHTELYSSGCWDPVWHHCQKFTRQTWTSEISSSEFSVLGYGNGLLNYEIKTPLTTILDYKSAHNQVFSCWFSRLEAWQNIPMYVSHWNKNSHSWTLSRKDHTHVFTSSNVAFPSTKTTSFPTF